MVGPGGPGGPWWSVVGTGGGPGGPGGPDFEVDPESQYTHQQTPMPACTASSKIEERKGAH